MSLLWREVPQRFGPVQVQRHGIDLFPSYVADALKDFYRLHNVFTKQIARHSS